MKYYNMDIDEILKKLKSNNDGLDDNLVKERLNQYGENTIKEIKGRSKLQKFFDQFKDLMIIILIIVSLVTGIYAFLYSHDYTDTIVIIVVVLLNAIMGFLQEQKAEVTLEGLKKYTTSTCKVKRNGHIKVIKTSYLVPGDIIILEAGDKIPADARIIASSGLCVDEAPLTGESISVKKNEKVLKGNLLIQDQYNMLFCGCNISNGHCEAIITNTGMNTEIGLVATSLNTPYEVLTPLQIKIREISKKLTFLIFLILIFLFFYGIFHKYDLMSIIMLCISLSVAAIPEGLPAVITITLSVGISELAKKKTVVKQMTAVETLGSTNIICSDKTGTITQNKMKVVETLIYDENKFNDIMALCNETIVDKNKLIGDPTETCMFDYLNDNKLDPVEINLSHKRVIDAPFDSERKLMSTVNTFNDKYLLMVKGSLENLINSCSKYVKNGKIVKLDKETIKEIKDKELFMATNALRVIGFAYKELKSIPNSSDKVLKEENNLIFVGMVGMIDPARKNVKDSVDKCFKAGIRPIMITGDSLITACAIAKDVHIIKDNIEGILGSELDKYSDEELIDIVDKYNVYARVSPLHKQRIVKAWQQRGSVVAMTGDGVNDAPAIKDAHVGVGMGITGTEVTKSVADIILLDDSFSTIVVAVEEGRRIFSNIRNNILYSLSSNFAEIFIILIGMFTSNTILLPIQILFIDLVTDSIPSICLAFEKSENNIMSRKPRGINKPIFTPFLYSSIIFSAILETIIVLLVFFTTNKLYGNDIAITCSLLSLVMQEIIYSFSCRNPKDFVIKQGLFSNKQLNIGILFLLIIQGLVFLTPLGSIFSITSLSTTLLLKIILFNIIGFFLYEFSKPILLKFFKD